MKEREVILARLFHLSHQLVNDYTPSSRLSCSMRKHEAAFGYALALHLRSVTTVACMKHDMSSDVSECAALTTHSVSDH